MADTDEWFPKEPEPSTISTLTKRCSCNLGTIWIDQGSQSRHRYKVTCENCNDYIKWASDEQLADEQATGCKVIIFDKTPPQESASLEAFYAPDDPS